MSTPVLEKLARTLMCNRIGLFQKFLSANGLQKNSAVIKWENVDYFFLYQEYKTLS